MKQQILTIAAATLLSIPTFCLAQDKPAEDKPAGDKPAGERPGRGGGGRFGGTPEERVKLLTERLSLTQEQQDKVKAIFAKGAESEAFKKAREAREKNTQLSEEERKAFGEAMRAQSEEVMAVLTPEQKKKWEDMRQQGRRGGRDGQGGQGGGEKK